MGDCAERLARAGAGGFAARAVRVVRAGLAGGGRGVDDGEAGGGWTAGGGASRAVQEQQHLERPARANRLGTCLLQGGVTTFPQRGAHHARAGGALSRAPSTRAGARRRALVAAAGGFWPVASERIVSGLGGDAAVHGRPAAALRRAERVA